MTTVAMLRRARLKTVPHGELTYYEIVCESRSQKCSLCAQCERRELVDNALAQTGSWG